MARRIRLRTTDRDWTVEVRDADIRVDGGGAFDIQPAEDDRYVIRHGEQVLVGAAMVSGETVWVDVDGDAFEFQIVRTGEGPASTRGHDALSPPMSATVTRIAVSVGQSVQMGQVLMSLEAMKMELPVRAPHDGVVTAIRCREGDLVQPGQTLIDVSVDASA